MEVSEKIRQQLAFFGITPENAAQTRVAIFTQIHEICFHGQGGYDWNTVYNMPIWLRRFTFNQIQQYNKNQQEQIENAKTGKTGQKTLIDPSGKVNAPEFLKSSEQYKKPAKWK
jgi:hypothetical protein